MDLDRMSRSIAAASSRRSLLAGLLALGLGAAAPADAKKKKKRKNKDKDKPPTYGQCKAYCDHYLSPGSGGGPGSGSYYYVCCAYNTDWNSGEFKRCVNQIT